MDVSQDRDPYLVLDPSQCPEAAFEAGAPKRPERCPVGLVERRLKDEGNGTALRDVPHGGCQFERMHVALDDTRAGNEHDRAAATQRDIADNYLAHNYIIEVGRSGSRHERFSGRMGGQEMFVGGFDEASEQRVGLERLRLELRVKLHGEEPRVVG